MAAKHSVFISYRRDDTADASGRVYDRLAAAFGAKSVFKDVDALPPGADFGAFIMDTLGQCRVVLAMIGPHWLDVRDAGDRRRLDDPDDWVRIEIETALRTEGIQVVPVLVNGAPMPNRDDLPESLRVLTALNAAIVRRDPDFHKDMEKLINALKEGALTGTVVVEAPTSAPSAAAALWADLQRSDDQEDLLRFAKQFPGTTEGLEARRKADRLKKAEDAWDSAMSSESITALDSFLKEWPEHPKRQDAIAHRAVLLQEEESVRRWQAAERAREEWQRAREEEQRKREEREREKVARYVIMDNVGRLVFALSVGALLIVLLNLMASNFIAVALVGAIVGFGCWCLSVIFTWFLSLFRVSRFHGMEWNYASFDTSISASLLVWVCILLRPLLLN